MSNKIVGLFCCFIFFLNANPTNYNLSLVNNIQIENSSNNGREKNFRSC